MGELEGHGSNLAESFPQHLTSIMITLVGNFLKASFAIGRSVRNLSHCRKQLQRPPLRISRETYPVGGRFFRDC